MGAKNGTPEERFWAKVEITDGCWNWKGGLNAGYGDLFLTRHSKPRSIRAHRFAYELLVGPIPDGLHIDHLCRNRACVNPAHLEPVTVRINNLRGFGASGNNARKTHCPKGHPYTPENTYYWHEKGWRYCKACMLVKVKAWREKQRALRDAGLPYKDPDGRRRERVAMSTRYASEGESA